jgi:predicted dehydrogenase
MTKLPVGVVGVGRLGNFHAKIYASIENADLVGVTDANIERANTVAKEHRCTAFPSLDALLAKVKAISIASTTRSHYEIAKKALSAGVHLLIEKPITTTVAEAQELIELARKNNCKIQVGHIERFNPALLALEHYSLAPMFVESHRLAQFNPRGTDVDVVLDLMIHDIDIIMSLVKSPVTEIHANGIPVVSDSIDIANARLQFENGCVANVTASRISQKKMRKMRMFQKDAYISIDFSDGLAEIFRLTDADDPKTKSTMMLGEIEAGKNKKKIVYEQPETKEVNALKYELESFIDAIQNGKEPAVTAEEGMQALAVAGRILDAIKNQQHFKL